MKPFINPLTMPREMTALAPDKIADDVTDPEQLESIREAFKACLVLTADWSYEAAARSGTAYGAMHEWVRVVGGCTS